MSSTWRCSGQRLSKACRTRAVVLFSYRNAASDTDNIGNSLTIGAKKLFENSPATQVRTDIEVEQTRQRQMNLGNLFQRGSSLMPFNRVISSSVNVIGTESRSAAHWWRLNCRYGVINVCSFLAHKHVLTITEYLETVMLHTS